MLWYSLEDLDSAECGLFLWCLFIGHIQYLSFLQELDIYNFKEYSSNCGKENTNYFDDEKYSKQYCEIYNVTI